MKNLFICCMAVILAVNVSYGVSCFWNNGDSANNYWVNPGNWDNLPTSVDGAYFNSLMPGDALIKDGDSAVAQNVYISHNRHYSDGSPLVLRQTGGSLSIGGQLLLGVADANAYGKLIMEGGEINVGVAGGLSVFVGKTGRGIIEMSGGTINTVSNFDVGGAYSGSDGVFNMTGGVLNVGGALKAGRVAGAKGRIYISGGTVNATHLYHDYGWLPEGDGLVDVSGTGEIILVGQDKTKLENYIANGYLTANGNNNDAVIVEYQEGGEWYTSMTAVPEPATMLLLGLGGIVLGRKRS
ncbi:PEP-CTERM motif protein [Limihaloglobus sulfuriphilus]|uniref:PEP-CTERM motif protein n=1 Tax=Limihaloglobus sulfuriphilus TaxID=1851148 RepID=A0A1Q2MEI1_9BACT|nr:PEP-CTERM sorting domain-containing protein [Limihaloglobus sulfuriphilus]AQQ70707.1 PEP-CTERM motif protein [Limihaloglobus sulfuriphilus]